MRHFLCALRRVSKLPFEAGIGFVFNSAEQALVVEEKFRSEHALAIELLVKCGSRLQSWANWLCSVLLLPVREKFLRLLEFQLVQKLKSRAQLGIVHHACADFFVAVLGVR